MLIVFVDCDGGRLKLILGTLIQKPRSDYADTLQHCYKITINEDSNVHSKFTCASCKKKLDVLKKSKKSF